MRYNPQEIEPKWQRKWEGANLFELPKTLKELKKKPKYYVLDMFPYPSGAGLHVGHPEGYTATDVVARYKRMKGFNVLHPMGWDAFGLPAERAAMREGIHPRIITKRNIDNFRKQIKRLGFFYDWSREISTTDETYYKWTQWIFLKLYEKGLAYLADVNVNWCPALQTVLANEEVKDGKYVETGDPVEQRLMRQWMLKITHYADRLLEDLNDLDWPENVKEMQRNWIGRSEGAVVNFDMVDHDQKLKVYTTRADTIFGVSFLAVAPKNPLIDEIVKKEQKAKCQRYLAESESDNSSIKNKTGVFTGSYAIHPFTQKQIPIYIANYVIMDYGTGIVMGVPSNDERDREFALKYDLPIINVIETTQDGTTVAINSSFLDGLPTNKALERIHDELESRGFGKRKIQYKLRDWLFSRQRYWGEPFPIIYDEEGNPKPLTENDLPVTLPTIDEYRPTKDGKPPLARANKDWLQVKLPSGEIGEREVNTMPQWAGSCWYYLRFIDPFNEKEIVNQELADYFMPVDLYIGGIEHAVLHLLYARFWHKVLFDCGVVKTKEPFQKLFNQGMIIAPSYRDSSGKYYHRDEVNKIDGKYYAKDTHNKINTQMEKMSKSRFNVVNPDDVIEEYGADAMRLYELFMGPLEQVKPWQMNGVDGVSRFLHRVFRLVVDEEENQQLSKYIDETQGDENSKIAKELHKTIKKVSSDIENLRFNTAIAQMMTFVNEVMNHGKIKKSSVIKFLHLLSPFAPHICDELNNILDGRGFLLDSNWPEYNENLLKEENVSLVCQVNGKKRATISVKKNLSREKIEEIALAHPDIQKFIKKLAVIKVIIVPNRLVNVVAK